MLGRAVRTALVVGTALTVINQGGAVLHPARAPGVVARIALNYAVPLLVSLYAMLGTIPELRAGQRSARGGTYRCRMCAQHDSVAHVELGEALPPCPMCGAAARWVPTGG